MTTEDLLIVLFCAIDDWVQQHGLPSRPGPAPTCADSEVLTFAVGRELLGYTSERRFRRVLLRDWRHLFPQIPAQSELNRRIRWLSGALELLRQHWLADLPNALGHWFAIDTTPLPVKHPSRVRGVDSWIGPDELHAGFGRCAAKAAWFYGFRLALCGPLIDPVPWVWALVPAAGNERDAAELMLAGAHDLQLLTDKGFRGRAFAAGLTDQRITLLTPPTKPERATVSQRLRRFLADHRNRIEAGINTLKDRFQLEQHRAKTFWGLLTRLMAKLAALTIRAVWRRAGVDVE
jgi:Transposase DDE domain